MDRVKYYQKRAVRSTLTAEQYVDVMDSRVILGINSLFYITNAVPLYVTTCHLILVHADETVRAL
jgi:hypothetical protein